MANELILNNSLIVTGSITASVGFSGDGSRLTNITASAEWDGSRNGNASITGSLVVSGSSANVDFRNVNGVSGSFSGSFVGNGSGLTGLNNFPFTGNAVITGSLTVSGSGTNAVDFQGIDNIRGRTFSGSFIGNGSGLTNLNINGTQASGSNLSGSFSGSFSGNGSGLTGVSAEWDGSRNGDSSITGSLDVSGSGISINLRGDTTIDQNILISNRNQVLDISIGSGSLPNSTVTRNTIAIGVNAGNNQTSGSSNLLIGQNSGKAGVSTENNVGIGINTLSKNIGVTIGTTQCASNVAIGADSMGQATCARQNVAIGRCTLRSGNMTGQVAVGFDAGRTASGIYGVYIGYESGTTNAGNHNIGIGQRAIQSTSQCTVAIGRCSLVTALNSTGNTALGYFAGRRVDDNSSNNVYIGRCAGPSSLTTENNQLYIANNEGDADALIRGDFDKKQVTINNQISASLFSGSFVGDGSGLTNVSGTGFPFVGTANITGSLIVSKSSGTNTVSLNIKNGFTVLSLVSMSLDFPNDTAAATGGVPLGGLYRSGNIIAIRLT